MQPGIMKTDGGPHPSDYYAGVAAAEIVQIEASKAGADVVQGRKLENEIIDILESAHDDLEAKEKAFCKASEEHVLSAVDPLKHGLDDVVAKIMAAGKRSKWSTHFQSKGTEEYIRAVVAKHFATAIHVTRSYHMDANPGHKMAASFQELWNRGY